MKLILRIAFRNLFRQKSRSILIGLAILVSVIFVSMFSSLNKGIGYNVMNAIVDSNIYGHFGVYGTEKDGKKNRAIIRDRDAMVELIKENIRNVKDVKDVLIGPSFAVGNGQGSLLLIMGVSHTPADLEREYRLLSGDFADFYNKSIENPLILEYHKADTLKVKVGEVVKVRLNNVYGQIQTAQLNVVAIVEMNNPILGAYIQGALPLMALKEIMGYGPNETQSLNVVLNNISNLAEVVPYADELHKKFTPELVFIKGEFTADGKKGKGVVAVLKSDKESIGLYEKYIIVTNGDIKSFSGEGNKAILSKSLAELLDTGPGSQIAFSYPPKSEGEDIKMSLEVVAVFDDHAGDPQSLAFINEKDFFKSCFDSPPEKYDSALVNTVFNTENPLTPALVHSFRLAERTYTQTDLNKKRRRTRRDSFSGTVIDIVSLQELNEEGQKVGSTMDMIGFVAILIILSIILVGVLNTVRMNIRERIREIGTVRAVGMQKKLVVRTLVIEVGLLAIFSSLLGILAAYGLMDLVSLITFPTKDLNFAIILSDGHILFKPAIKVILVNIFTIISLVMLAAWFPARKAAKKPVAEALGHYE